MHNHADDFNHAEVECPMCREIVRRPEEHTCHRPQGSIHAMSQFSADDERAGHARMIDAIRAEQIKNEPEPDHEPWFVEEQRFCDPMPWIVAWCCDWHRLQHEHHTCQRPQGAKP